MSKDLMQEMLGYMGKAENAYMETNADIVFVIDATGSMQPVINKVKLLTKQFHGELDKELQHQNRKINSLRVKVIVFRDYYVDGIDAMKQSGFFVLPEEEEKFYEYVNNIKATGGGDEPESGLEALSLALKSDFIQEGDSKRHIVVLFTDASAHPFEKAKKSRAVNYPEKMFHNLDELFHFWGTGKEHLSQSADQKSEMDRRAKRLVLFTPDVYPWNEIKELENVVFNKIDRGKGGTDMNLESVIKLVAYSIVM